jgi:hypothetical protein
MIIMGKGGFSFKRALGVSSAKSKISRSIGVPLTKSGRQRKVGKTLGCMFPIIIGLGILIFCISGFFTLLSAL